MMRSLSSAVSGLRAHQTKMDVIGNNIANVNTYGFKSSRVTFTDVYYQTLSSGNAPTAAMGGTNPTQIGYGAKVATIDVLNSVSSAASTDRAMDIYINGDGLIAVKDPSGNLFYTRMGVLGFDAMGRLVDMNGNFVMGFPMGDDGPIVNADGSVDIDDLSVIQVDTDVLDELTGISISDSGEIIGTMAGDATISLNKNRPAWLVDMVIDEDSHIIGNINLVMAAVSKAQTDSTAAWVTSITSPANSMVDGTYSFSYDDTNDRITAVNALTGDIYTGTYKRGATVELTNAAGKVGFVIETHAYTEPAGSSTFDNIQFQMEYELTLSGTDKGGNKHEQTIAVGVDPNSMATTMRFDELDVTLTIDTSLLQESTRTELAYNYTGISGNAVFGDWLLGASVKEDSTINGSVDILVGYDYTLTGSTTLYSNIGFIQGQLDDLITAICETQGISGKFTISSSYDATGALVYTLSHDGSPFTLNLDPINRNNQPITVTYPAAGTPYNLGTYNRTTVTFSTANLTSNGLTGAGNATGISDLQDFLAANGYPNGTISITGNGAAPYTQPFNLLIGDPVTTTLANAVVDDGFGNLEVRIGANTFTILNGWGGALTTSPVVVGNRALNPNVNDGTTLVTATTTNKIILESGGNIIGETVYNGQSSLTIGDITLQLDRDDLMAYFTGGTAVYIKGASGVPRESLGMVSQVNYKDWAYSRDAASATTGVGESFVIGQIAIAQVRNMAGMTQEGNGYFTTNFNSGDATFWIPGLGGTGDLTAGYLEQSNVDISKEFTDMITTQRGFQANTRIITVSDEMLQELVNLKR